jgi:hypothetical protein
MPSDDLILNVRQIAGYTPSGVQPTDSVVFQRGLGGPYLSTSALDFVGNALAEAGPMSVGNVAPPDTAAPQLFTDGLGMVPEGQLMWNCYVGGGQEKMVAAGAGGRIVVGTDGTMVFQSAAPTGAQTVAQFLTTLELSPTGYATVGEQILLARDPISPLEAATAQWVGANTVTSFNGRVGATTLWVQDIIAAGGAPIFSPVFSGCPRAPTPPYSSFSTRIATTEFVQRNAVIYIDNLLDTQPFVFTFNGRSGDVVLTAADFEGVSEDILDSPALTGVPTAPTALANTNTNQIATCQFVVGQIDNAGFAPLDSPNFTGYSTAITPPPGTNDGQIATCAFVQAAVAAGVAGVASFNGRVGAVVLDAADITAAGGAVLASPTFTGVPLAPTAAPGTNTAQIATTAFVSANSVVSFNARTGAIALTAADITGAGGAVLASPAFSGVPTAPTAATGTTTGQLATTAFVMNEINAVNAGVISFNGRSGLVTLNSGDVSAAGGATLSSPAFVGVPTAPTAAVGTSTTQIATTAYVLAAIAAAPAAVASFNGRTGAVVLTAADVTNANPAYLPLAGGTLTGFLTLPPMATSGNASNKIDGAAGSNRMLFGTTAGVLRWGLLLGTGAAESGGNTGSDFNLWAYSDTGAGLGAALSIVRASLNATFAGTVSSPQVYFGMPTVGDFFAGIGGAQVRAINFAGNGVYAFNFNLSSGLLQWIGNSASVFSIGYTGVVSASYSFNAPNLSIATTGTIGGVTLQINNVYANNGTVFCVQVVESSARALKTRVVAPSAITPALEAVAAVPVRQFNWRSDPADAPVSIGWLAEDVKAAFPSTNIVRSNGDADGIGIGGMCAILWQAVQELTAKVAALEAQAA